VANEVAAQQSNVMAMASAASTTSSNGSSTQTGGVEMSAQARTSLSSLLGSVQVSGTPPPPPPPSESASSTDGGLNSTFMDKLASVLKAKEAVDSQNASNAAAALFAGPAQESAKNSGSSASAIFERLLGVVAPVASASGA
jgi:hypothetical protein